jgi:hypothetical protein
MCTIVSTSGEDLIPVKPFPGLMLAAREDIPSRDVYEKD